MKERPAAFLIPLAFTCSAIAQPSGPAIWHIKAVTPDGRTLDVKAFDPNGMKHDVKAVVTGDRHLLDVKVMDEGGQLPVKVILSEDAFAPVKGIGADGRLWDVKALDADGAKLDVKGVARSGNLYHIKALGAAGQVYGVKAISPEGHLYDVKGIKMSDAEVEMEVQGVKVAAHVKALPQTGGPEEDPIWNVKAIGRDGHFIDLKMIDGSGTPRPVKAFVENGNDQVMDVKALAGGRKLPVKVMVASDLPAPVQAIGPDGARYDLMAVPTEGKMLKVQAVARDGMVFQIKVIDASGEQLGVKAISPHGELRDIKGLAFMDRPVEATVAGVPVMAHVKAVPQLP